MAPLSIAPLASTSPTAAAEMAVCGLRAGLSSCRDADAWVLHDPRLWLGIAFHSLMEKARRGLAGPALVAAWNEIVERFAQEAGLHQFDRRFASAVHWPNYYLAEERAISAAADLAARSTPPHARPASEQQPTSGTEKRLVARSGRLVGRPDRFNKHAVTDYKSNLPDQTTAAGSEIFRRNRRQVQIYAAIIAEVCGFWPEKGILAAASGELIEFDLNPTECDAEADRAVHDLEAWNRRLASARQSADIASPSAQACQNCKFQLLCPAFWPWLAQHQAAGMPLNNVAVTGRLKYVQLGNDGDVQTVALEGASASVPQIATPSLVTRRSIHGDLSQNPVGAECRIVGAELRRDGRLVAGMRTVPMPIDQIPEIVIRADATRPLDEVQVA
ncbi:PD-(D/E)XK nuclease family protein [Bradyrhizobium manausense]|uniref:PD-(D/E)XK nuclease family protein n=1 Tax=Bradyrhizobium manausense TaxID=989370 RepID=UPI001BA7E49F|nr:PD-(D/E)XK nuclease family protein [Bradyrhizobium manausense]MBR0793047.1 PD-(D/E)XK nuclease family protein [Bradyrhizobium manausense]